MSSPCGEEQGSSRSSFSLGRESSKYEFRQTRLSAPISGVVQALPNNGLRVGFYITHDQGNSFLVTFGTDNTSSLGVNMFGNTTPHYFGFSNLGGIVQNQIGLSSTAVGGNFFILEVLYRQT